MNLIYSAQVHVPCQNSSITVTQDFFKGICREFKIPGKTELHLELAIEEAMVSLLKNTDYQAQGLKEQIKVLVEIFADAVTISIKLHGRPFDFTQIPKYNPNDTSSKIEPLSFGVFILENIVDSVQWRYVEKEGQEIVLNKKLPEMLKAAEKLKVPEPEDAPKLEFIPENTTCRRVSSYQDAVALACCAYDISGYDHRPVLYYPQELFAKMDAGLIESLIAIDTNGVVFGHYALFRNYVTDKVAELGAAFVRPECRKGGVFNQLALKLHEHAFGLGLDGVYSLSTTDHIVTQKMSERYDRLTTAIRLAFFPPIFIADGPDSERAAGALNYRPLSNRVKRDIYVPDQYREIVLNTYKVLNIEVNPVGANEAEEILAREQNSSASAVETNYFDCHRDLNWNKAAIKASGNDIIAHKIQAMTDILKESNVTSIMLFLDLESPYTPKLAEEAAKLGYFYSGVFPSSFKDGHDALEMQLLNQIQVDPAKIILYQPSAKDIMAFIRQEAPQVFISPK